VGSFGSHVGSAKNKQSIAVPLNVFYVFLLC